MNKRISLCTSALLFVLVITGCRSPSAARLTETPTFFPLPPVATDPPALVFASLTPEPASKKATETATITPTPTPQLPLAYLITLAFEVDTVCGGAPYENEYDVSLTADSITMIQLNAGITTSGPYDPVTGEFTTTATNLPGNETYTGSIDISSGDNGETSVAMNGETGYGNDPNYCSGNTSSQLFSGEASLP